MERETATGNNDAIPSTKSTEIPSEKLHSSSQPDTSISIPSGPALEAGVEYGVDAYIRNALDPTLVDTSSAQNNFGFDSFAFDLGASDWDQFLNASASCNLDAGIGEFNSLDPFAGFDIPFWFEDEDH